MKEFFLLLGLLFGSIFYNSKVSAQNNLCSQEFKIWNASIGQFENSLRGDFFYDSFGKLQHVQFLYWDTLTINYNLYSQGFLMYNGNVEPSYVLGQNYNAVLNSWTNQFQMFNEFDMNGNRFKDSVQYYDTLAMTWLPFSYREIFFYNAGNFNTGQVTSEWDQGGYWSNIDSIYRILDSTGLTLEYFSYSWNPNLNIWDKSFKVVDNYQGGKIIDSVYQSWNGTTYINNFKTHFEYNINGKLFIKSGFRWGVVNNNWDNASVDSFFYDVNNNLIYDISYGYNNNNQWVPTLRIDYSYGNCLFTGLTQLKNDVEILTYPNPFTTSINFYFDKPIINASIKFLTVTGQMVYETNSLTGKSFLIDIAELANGIYIGEVIENGQVRRVKLVKN